MQITYSYHALKIYTGVLWSSNEKAQFERIFHVGVGCTAISANCHIDMAVDTIHWSLVVEFGINLYTLIVQFISACRKTIIVEEI